LFSFQLLTSVSFLFKSAIIVDLDPADLVQDLVTRCKEILNIPPLVIIKHPMELFTPQSKKHYQSAASQSLTFTSSSLLPAHYACDARKRHTTGNFV
jgi:hypothetical protein